MSTFHTTRLGISNWKIPSLSTFFDSLTKEQDKLIQMGALRISDGKDHALIVQGSNNANSKEKKLVKEKKPRSGNEYGRSNLTDEGSMKKFKKKGSTSKFYYCRNGFHTKNKCFNKSMDIISHLLDKGSIEVPDELEKPAKSLEYCHSAQFQGDINYSLSSRVK